MFTGLVEEKGVIRGIERTADSFTLEIGASVVLSDATFGASICVEGVCLSLTAFGEGWFKVGLAPETLRKTSLGALGEGDLVNLERSVTPASRMGGHYVQGHVDGTGAIAAIEPEGDAFLIRIKMEESLARYVVPKGYVAVDGASLTVIEAGTDYFTLTLISHSQPLITLGGKRVGDPVNIETDIMAKYAERLLQGRMSQ